MNHLEVHMLYQDLLHRNADPSGISSYRYRFRNFSERKLRNSDEYKKRLQSFYSGNDVSICCAVMDRWEMLSKSISTWFVPNVKEIILVDYNSKQCVWTLLKNNNLLDPRIKVIRLVDKTKWCLSKAYNIAFHHASCNIIMKMDTDYKLLDSNFFLKHKLQKNVFFAGNWRNGRNENEHHLNGFIYIFKHDFFRINGYSEHILTYGRDDEDLYERLRCSNIKRLDIGHDFIYHIPHSDSLRTINQHLKTSNCHDEIIHNESLPLWKSSNQRQAFFSIPSNKQLFFISSFPFFIIQPHHGLGNRLRAFMSALHFSHLHNMTIVLQWIKDEHIQADFNDIFDSQFPLIYENTKQHFDLGGSHYNYVDDDKDHNKGTPLKFNNSSIHAKSNCILNFDNDNISDMSFRLRSLHIKKSLLNSIPHFNSYTIGVHIRMDSVMSSPCELSSNYSQNNFSLTKNARSKCNYKHFIPIIKQYILSHNCNFFICTDTPAVLHTLKSLFPNRIIFNNFNSTDTIVNRSASSISNAFIDMISLSKCNALIGSTWSSFSEVAQYFRETPFDFVKLAGEDF